MSTVEQQNAELEQMAHKLESMADGADKRGYAPAAECLRESARMMRGLIVDMDKLREEFANLCAFVNSPEFIQGMDDFMRESAAEASAPGDPKLAPTDPAASCTQCGAALTNESSVCGACDFDALSALANRSVL